MVLALLQYYNKDKDNYDNFSRAKVKSNEPQFTLYYVHIENALCHTLKRRVYQLFLLKN